MLQYRHLVILVRVLVFGLVLYAVRRSGGKSNQFSKKWFGSLRVCLASLEVGLIGLLVLVLVRVLLGWSLCYLDAGREKQSIF